MRIKESLLQYCDVRGTIHFWASVSLTVKWREERTYLVRVLHGAKQ